MKSLFWMPPGKRRCHQSPVAGARTFPGGGRHLSVCFPPERAAYPVLSRCVEDGIGCPGMIPHVLPQGSWTVV